MLPAGKYPQLWGIEDLRCGRKEVRMLCQVEYVRVGNVVVDQGVVNGDTLCNVFLHPGDQLRGGIFQLVLSQKAVDNDNPIFVKRLKVIRCEEGANFQV